MRLIAEARKRRAKLIVIDPRRTPPARRADIFVQPLPGTDGALAWGLAHYLIETQSYDRQFIFPAASFLERSELHYHTHHQMVTLTTKVLDIPGVQDEYTFWHDLARRLGFGQRYFPWESEEQVNRWILEPTKITIDELRKHPEGYVYDSSKHKKYQDRPFPTPTGKFEFSSQYLKEFAHPEVPEYRPPRYMNHPNKEYPFVLITGARQSLYYLSRYRNIARFRAAIPVAEVEIHPADATRLEIKDKVGAQSFASVQDEFSTLPPTC